MDTNVGLQPGTILQGKYRIEGILGQGGFGISYLAYDITLKRKVAIKEFFPGDFCNRDKTTSHVTLGTENTRRQVEQMKRRFQSEAEHIAQFNNPGIVKIHSIFEENDTVYYEMDFIEGESLSEMVKKDGPLSESKALKYINTIGNALDYIHSRNVNHYDVKPGNIIVRKSDDTPILIDFGLSKQYDSNGEQTSTMMMGVSHGYAPLEQYTAEELTKFSPATDLYALAATLYFMLSGETPLKAPLLASRKLTFPASIPQKLTKAISKAMSTDKEDRHDSVKEFLRDINSAGDPGQGEDDESTVYKTGGNTATPTPPTPPTTNHTSFDDDRKNISSWIWITSAAVAAALVGLIFWLKPFGNQDSEQPKEANGSEMTDPAVQTAELEIPEGLDPVITNMLKNMVYVEGGTFSMGSNDTNATPKEKPAHQETVESFRLGKYEVTQKEWMKVTGKNPSKNIGENLPVDNVSYEDCLQFLRKLNEMTGMIFRLPSEAEWEYAAQGGKDASGSRFSGSNDLESVGWYRENSDDKTHKVGSKKANNLGIYDMTGNVWEITSDQGSKSYGAPVYQDSIVRRGGAKRSPEINCRITVRDYITKNERYTNQGLRLAL